MATSFPLALDPNVKVAQAARSYAKNGRVVIPDFLTPSSAQWLDAQLKNLPWSLTTFEGGNQYEYDLRQLSKAPAAQRQAFQQRIFAQARNDFQFVHYSYALSENVPLPDGSRHPIVGYFDFVNSQQFLDVMRRITGNPAVCMADAMASCYLSGHFLTTHDDTHDKHERVAAYVLSMTRDWNPNWGGQLQFFDDAGNVIEGFNPAYNTLMMFRVPQRHAVTYVTPFAGAARLSLTGWLRTA